MWRGLRLRRKMPLRQAMLLTLPQVLFELSDGDEEPTPADLAARTKNKASEAFRTVCSRHHLTLGELRAVPLATLAAWLSEAIGKPVDESKIMPLLETFLSES